MKKAGSKLRMAYFMIAVLLLVGLLFWGAKMQHESVWIAWLAALVAIPTQYGLVNGWINSQASANYRPELAPKATTGPLG
jgi:hypothetical protein